MIVFINLKRYISFLAVLGFDRPHGRTIRIVLSIIVFIAICSPFSITAGHLFLEKDASFEKQVQCGAAVLSLLYVVIVATIFSYWKQQFFGMVGDIEEQIEVRYCKYGRTIYKETSDAFETFTIRMILFLNVFLTILMGVIPATVASYYNYYVNDMGEASFIESVPSK